MAGCIVLALTGCRQFVRVEAQFSAQPPQCEGAPPKRGIAVLRVPDECVALSMDGEAMYLSSCRSWIGELASQLRDAGLTVRLDDQLRRAEQAGRGPVEAAREEGADYLVRVDQFDVELDSSWSHTHVELSYWDSAADGARQDESALDAEGRLVLRRMVDERNQLPMLWTEHAWFVRADSKLTITDVRRDLSIRTIQHADVRPHDAKDYTRVFLFRGKGVHWRPIRPDGIDAEEGEMSTLDGGLRGQVAPDLHRVRQRYATEVGHALMHPCDRGPRAKESDGR